MRANPLVCFAVVMCQSDRDVWYRLYTCRELADGSLRWHYNDTSLCLGSRLAERLCDRYGIADRGALHCGRVFVRGTDWKGGAA